MNYFTLDPIGCGCKNECMRACARGKYCDKFYVRLT